MTKNLHILNDPTRPTFYRHSEQFTTPTVIDLAVVMEGVCREIFQDLRINYGAMTGSDHVPITWSGKFQEDTEIDDSTIELFQKDPAAKTAWVDLWKKRYTQLGEKMTTLAMRPTENDIETLTETLLNALVEVSEDTIRRRTKKKPPRTRWWTKGLSTAKEKVQIARRLWRKRIISHEDWRTQENYYEKIVSQTKRKHFAEKIDVGTGKDIWSYLAWTRGNHRTTTPPILKSNGKLAINTQDKAETFKEKILDTKTGPSGNDETEEIFDQLPWNNLTHREVSESLENYSTDTAPGESKITYTILRWLSEADENILPDYFMAITRGGHHPQSLKLANVVIIPKPNKSNYTLAKAYRPIALLECVSKLLERIITRRLNWYATEYNLLPNTQFGGRPNSAVDDAGLTLVHDIQCAWNYGLVTLVLFFDISGYFNNIDHKRIARKLRCKRIPEILV